ncbi:MAG: NAD+ synthase [Acidobacteria bacterium]|nr:NAD+ synthase [Acidobacteriota bacterium]
MKIALAQINTIVGDFTGNLAVARRILTEARQAGAELVVFPELTFAGYPPQDLLEKQSFFEKNLDALHSFRRDVKGLAAVIGYLDRNPHSYGKPLFNSAALLEDGEIRQVTHKCLLPSYDVFDEARYFEPCAQTHGLFDFQGGKIGVTICEDFWNDADMFPHRLYRYDPVAELARHEPALFININASPFSLGKPLFREKLLTHAARKYNTPVIMVNQVGGYDEIIFDGNSLAVDDTGKVIARCPEFAEELKVVDLSRSNSAVPYESPPLAEQIFRALRLGIHDYSRKCGFRKAVIGLSGGIDSALVACLAADALGPQNILGVAMPSMFNSPESVEDARRLAENLGIRFQVIPIREIYDVYIQDLASAFENRPFDATEENLQARIRGNILMALSNKFGYLLLSTGNKSELAVGYSTLYGDMCGGLAVIADLLKTQVYEVSHWINRQQEIIPRSTLTKPPSAELRPNQKDQDDLPPYEVLDDILSLYIEEQLSLAAIVGRGFDPALVRRIITMVDRNEYKRRQAPPCLRITGKAFGLGRRFPIVQKFQY